MNSGWLKDKTDKMVLVVLMSMSLTGTVYASEISIKKVII